MDERDKRMQEKRHHSARELALQPMLAARGRKGQFCVAGCGLRT